MSCPGSEGLPSSNWFHLLIRAGSLCPLRVPSHSVSKNGVSFFLREVIHESGAYRVANGPVSAHDICGVSTSAAFHRNWSMSSVLEATTWRTSSVFVSFYLRDIQHEFDDICSLSLFVAAGE